jgi:SAM-dependent methyltransferase
VTEAADGSAVSGSVAGGSVNFDRAAGYYDQTRGHPPDTVAAQTQLLAGELAGAGPVLEIGVGTGRIAVPLAGAGVAIAGLDLSAEMLAVLASKNSPVPVVRGSALELPLADGSVAAVIACHVLHLIPDWRAVVGEALRVLRPGGLLLAARGSVTDGLGADLRRRFREAAGLPARGAPGQDGPGQDGPEQGGGPGQGRPRGSVGLDRLSGLDELMAGRGIPARHLPEITSSRQLSVAEWLDRVAANLFSWTWAVDPERRLSAVVQTRAWVTGTMGDPAAVLLPADRIRWHSYRIP